MNVHINVFEMSQAIVLILKISWIRQVRLNSVNLFYQQNTCELCLKKRQVTKADDASILKHVEDTIPQSFCSLESKCLTFWDIYLIYLHYFKGPFI